MDTRLLFSSAPIPQCIVCLEAFLLWKAFNTTPIKGLCNHDSCWCTNSSHRMGLQQMIQEGEGEVISCGLKESFNYLYLQVRSLKPVWITPVRSGVAPFLVYHLQTQPIIRSSSTPPGTWGRGAVSDSSEMLCTAGESLLRSMWSLEEVCTSA